MNSLDELQTVGWLNNSVRWRVTWFGVADYKTLCSINAHAGANTHFPCIWCYITQQQLQTQQWRDIAATVDKRTSHSYKVDLEKVKEFEEQPTHKQLQSCSTCGEFGHTKVFHAQNPVRKAEARCEVCGQSGHWRNSNSDNSSGLNTTEKNADCMEWTKKNKKIWKQQVLTPHNAYTHHNTQHKHTTYNTQHTHHNTHHPTHTWMYTLHNAYIYNNHYHRQRNKLECNN